MWFWSACRARSKSPTSIYLANRGIKTGNVPLVPDIMLPRPQVERLKNPLVVGLYATQRRIVQIHDEIACSGSRRIKTMTNISIAAAVTEEVALSRRLCAQHSWPIIDSDPPLDRGDSRRPVLKLLAERRRLPVS